MTCKWKNSCTISFVHLMGCLSKCYIFTGSWLSLPWDIFFCFAVWELRLKDYSKLLHSTNFFQNKLCTNDCGCFNTKKGSFLSQLPTNRKEYNWSVNKPTEKLPLSDKTGSQSFATIILVNKSVLHRNTFQQLGSLFFGFQQSLSLCRLLRLNRNVMEIDALCRRLLRLNRNVMEMDAQVCAYFN